MKNPFFLFFFFSFLFLLSLTAVIADDLTAPYSQNYNIQRPCSYNGTFCSASAYCALATVYPDGTTLFSNQSMTYGPSFFNITFLKNNNTQLGYHPSIMTCCQSGICNIDTFNVVVTADGKPVQAVPIQLIGMAFAFLLVALGSFFDKLNMLKTGGAAILMIVGMLTLYPGYGFINYSTLLGQAIGTVSIALGFYFLIEGSFSRDDQQERYDQESEGVMDE